MKTLASLFALAVACQGPTAGQARAPRPEPVEIQRGPEPARPSPREATKSAQSTRIAFGADRVCLLRRGALHCWSAFEGAKAPVTRMTGLGEVVDVALGREHGCALEASGRVLCWGGNSYGQLGAGSGASTELAPVRVAGVEGAQALAAGSLHTCALLAEGNVSCWGWNASGQTGSDVEYSEDARELVLPSRVPGITGASRIRASRDQTCALVRARWSCWGRSYLDTEIALANEHPEPMALPELDGVRELSLHDESACGVFDLGVACWGSGSFSLLGSRALRPTRPLPVPLEGARSVVVSSYHACALLADGKVSCFGIDSQGQLGRGRSDESYHTFAPERVEGLPRASALQLGPSTSCAVTERDELWCWGVLPHVAVGPTNRGAAPTRIPVEDIVR
ncbi:MAG: hypothetical protein U0263_22170 [Polyangiaceae bacterium]